MNYELYHYGVKGQKWGIRKDTNSTNSKANGNRRHLGIDEHGNINLIKGKTSRKAKRNFAIKTSLWIGSMALNYYVIKHPETIAKGQKTVENILKRKGSQSIDALLNAKPVDSGIYSKKLGRMLTVAEAFEAGFDLSD